MSPDSSPASIIGRRVQRLEDPTLLTGSGCYVDDIERPGMLHARAVRSTIAHGVLSSIDATEALAMDGVVGVYTASDLDELGVGELRVTTILPGQHNETNPALAKGRVHYVGQPVAVVVATDPYVAEDAAEAVVVDVERLPAVVDPLAALEDGSDLLYPEWGTNVVAEHRMGTGCPDEVIDSADIVIAERLRINRQSALPLEPRGVVADYDPRTGDMTVWVSTQSPHHVKSAIAKIAPVPEHKIRLISPHVGGGFGTKEYPLAEELLACVLARVLARPVKWVIDMHEHLVSTPHAREQVWDVELAADADGRIKGARGRILYNAGAHLSSTGLGPALQAARMFSGPYDFDHLDLHIVGVVTNKVPAGAYRGYGIPQATFVMERLVDELARRLDLDPVEVRRRNLIPAKAQPYTNPSGLRYDGGDYSETFDLAVEAIGYAGFAAERERARAEGRLLGVGIGTFVLTGGLAPSAVMGRGGTAVGAHSAALVRMDGSGKATVLSGTCSQGQGTYTAMAQLCAAQLGLDPERDVTVILGDTAVTPYDPVGSISSRVTSIAGATVIMASGEIRAKLLRIAAHMLEAAPEDLDLADGRAFVKGSPSQGLTVAEIAAAAYRAHDLPEGELPGLDATATLDPPDSSYPFATHAAIVEVDPETFGIKVLRYVVAHDSGTIVNPMLLEGQIHGGVTQGIAGAAFEHAVYDADGQPLASSLMDYLVPTAADIPQIDIMLRETPAPEIPGGVKGGAEAGTVGPAAVLANAVADALSGTSHAVFELPLDPERLFTLQHPPSAA